MSVGSYPCPQLSRYWEAAAMRMEISKDRYIHAPIPRDSGPARRNQLPCFELLIVNMSAFICEQRIVPTRR